MAHLSAIARLQDAQISRNGRFVTGRVQGYDAAGHLVRTERFICDLSGSTQSVKYISELFPGTNTANIGRVNDSGDILASIGGTGAGEQVILLRRISD